VIGSRHDLNEFEAQRSRHISPRLPGSIKIAGWGESSVMLKDRWGEWWMATGEGLARFPRVPSAADLAHTAPKMIYGRPIGFTADLTLHVFEDKRGGIWVSGLGWRDGIPQQSRFSISLRPCAN